MPRKENVGDRGILYRLMDFWRDEARDVQNRRLVWVVIVSGLSRAPSLGRCKVRSGLIAAFPDQGICEVRRLQIDASATNCLLSIPAG